MLFSYPCRGFFRPWDRGNVNLVTIPSGPKTDDGILSSESDKDFVSADCSCKLHVLFYFRILHTKVHCAHGCSWIKFSFKIRKKIIQSKIKSKLINQWLHCLHECSRKKYHESEKNDSTDTSDEIEAMMRIWLNFYEPMTMPDYVDTWYRDEQQC